MAYDQYWAAGGDTGSSVVESAWKHLIAAREKEPGYAGASLEPTLLRLCAPNSTVTDVPRRPRCLAPAFPA